MKFKIGDKVGILNESFGWGPIKKGDFGIVISTSTDSVCVNIPGKSSSWTCKEKDIIKCLPRSSMSCPACKFVNDELNMHEERMNAGSSISAKIYKRIKIPDADIFKTVSSLVEKVEFDNHEMCVVTKRCYIDFVYQDIPLHIDVGRFKCTVPFNDRHIRIQQLELNKRINHYDHPHVSDTSPCFGTYYIPIKEAVETYDICRIIVLLLDFLNSCTVPGWYHSVLAWMPIEEQEANGIDTREHCHGCNNLEEECTCDWCDECERIVQDCSCEWCNNCDRRVPDCVCARCPDTHYMLTNEAFPDSYCSRCTSLIRNLDNGKWECNFNGVIQHYRDIEEFIPTEDNASAYSIYNNGILFEHPNIIRRRANVRNVPTNQQSNT